MHRSLKALLLSFLLIWQLLATPAVIIAEEITEQPSSETTSQSTPAPEPSQQPVPSQAPIPAQPTEPGTTQTTPAGTSSEDPDDQSPAPSTQPTVETPQAIQSETPESGTQPSNSPSPTPALTDATEVSEAATPSASPTALATIQSNNNDQTSAQSNSSEPSKEAAKTSNSEPSTSNKESDQNQTGTSDLLAQTASESATASVSATTGHNTSVSEEETVVGTGDAVAQIDLIQIINALIVNSGLTVLSYDITDPNQATLDLTHLAQPGQGQATSLNCSSATSVCQIADANQEAIVNTSISVEANTGNNTVEGEETYLETGNADALANVIQVINTQLYNSNIAIVVINILVPWSGDIWLPAWADQQMGSANSGQTGETSVDSNAQVSNTTNASANTGHNQQSGDINHAETGNATAQVTQESIVNSSFYQESIWQLFIQNQGLWLGGLALGIPTDTIEGDEQDSTLTESPSLASYLQYLANVQTNINVSANTGSNQAIGDENEMYTGSATAIANLLQLINTTWTDSRMFIGVINVMRPWTGVAWIGSEPEPELEPEIGGPELEIEIVDETEPEPEETEEEYILPQVALEVDKANDSSVQPGEQVQFIAYLHNYSDVTVEQPVMQQSLIGQDGQMVGGFEFEMPPLPAHKKARLKFSMKVPGTGANGEFTTHFMLQEAKADYAQISNIASSHFLIQGWIASPLTPDVVQIPKPSVLGVRAAEPNAVYAEGSGYLAPSVWMLPPLLLAYMAIKRVRKKLV